MAAPIINPLPPAPLTTDSGDVFDSKAFVFVGALDPFRAQLQAAADYIEGGVQAVVDATAQAVTDATQGAEAARDAAQLAETGAQTAQGLAEGARDDAVLAKGGAETAQGLSEDARNASQMAETGAVAAKDKALSIIGTVGAYPDTTAGLAATTDGQYFALDGNGRIYLNNAGVAEQITDYDSLADGIGMISAALDAINGEVV